MLKIMDLLDKVSQDVARLQKERDEAKEQLEFDRTKCAEFLTALTQCMDSRFWLTEGRGSYEWDDDRYRSEFKEAAKELLGALRPLREMAANLTAGLATTDEVIRARMNLKAEVVRLTAERDEARAEAAQAVEELERWAKRWSDGGSTTEWDFNHRAAALRAGEVTK